MNIWPAAALFEFCHLIRLLGDCFVLSRTFSTSTTRTMHLIHDSHGQKIRYDAFRSAWDIAMNKAVNEGIGRWRFHDLKRKGVTDAKGAKLAASGHKSASMVPIYDVSVPEVAPTK
jgi:hypothetical protein